MPALANLVAGAEGSEAAGVEIIGTRAGARVPGLARVILLEAGPRVYRSISYPDGIAAAPNASLLC